MRTHREASRHHRTLARIKRKRGAAVAKRLEQDLLPVSLLIPKYIESVPNHNVLTPLFDSREAISLIHKHVL